MATAKRGRHPQTSISAYEQLHTFLTKTAQLPESEATTVADHFQPVQAAKGDILVHFGETCRYLYFIGQGCLRLYSLDKSGNDVTSKFGFENSLLTTMTSFIDGKPSRDSLIAYEPSSLMRIDRSTFLELTATMPALGAFYQRVLQFAFIHSQMRVYSFMGMEGIEKVKWVMEHEPELLVRVSSKAVASYLGMTNATLSRLRAKLQKGEL